MSPIGITLLMLAGLAGFAWLAWRKLALLTRLQPEVRWDHPGQRLRSVLVNGFLQRRMIRREPAAGVMHAVIFLGFMALLLRKLQLIVIGYHEPFTFPGLAGGAFAALKDAVELAVLAALAYAFLRRYVLRPRRLERNREALLVLVLITVIMFTDLAFDGFRFALLAGHDAGIAHERDFAFAGQAIAAQLAGWSPAALGAGYHASYWLQLITVFAFLVILPTGEHFHIATALPALFLRRGRPANEVPAVDLEKMMADDADPATLRVGARTVRDLSWKDGLDVFTCTECGRCKDACPTFLTGKPLSMKWVNDSLKHHLVEQRERLLAPWPPQAPAAAGQEGHGGSAAAPAAPAEDPLPALIGPVISEDALWACTTCGYCEAACPIELEHLPRLFKLRQQRVMMEGVFPHELKPVFEAWESQNNPWGLPQQQRADWARDLDVPRWTDAAQAADFDVLFYVGSATSYDPRGQKIARAFVQVLRATGTRFAILGEAESSTGECARRAGNEMLFQQLAGALVEKLNGLEVTRIVTCDPHAYNTLANEYPAFGGRWQVEHHTQFIARVLGEGRLQLARGARRVLFHDPCYLGRHNGEYEAPRRVIAALAADTPLEFELAGPKAMCCGAGGARMWLEETIGQRINVLRTEQALARQPAVIATACPYCAVMIGDGLKTLAREGEVRQLDIAELVAAALPDAGGHVPPAGPPAADSADPTREAAHA
ncbi:MAG: (Fe-S)-binding protein [Rubrivivax sp.]|nr:(Fe-S)-binding protein [Rubrivivax sp.]